VQDRPLRIAGCSVLMQILMHQAPRALETLAGRQASQALAQAVVVLVFQLGDHDVDQARRKARLEEAALSLSTCAASTALPGSELSRPPSACSGVSPLSSRSAPEPRCRVLQPVLTAMTIRPAANT